VHARAGGDFVGFSLFPAGADGTTVAVVPFFSLLAGGDQMTIRGTLTRVAVVVAATVGVVLAGASVGRTATTGQLCKTFKNGGLTYTWETAGTGWTCSSAKPWVVKLSKDHVGSLSGRVPLHNGPAGFHCYATDSHRGLAAGGICFKNTLAFPKSGFLWDGA